MKNKNRPLFAVIGLALFLCIGGTAAYFTYWQQLQNNMTVGGNTITVTEEFEPPAEMTEGENKYKKRISITNTGTVPCFVRVFVAFSDSSVRDKSEFSPDKDGTDYYPVEDYGKHLPEDWEYVDPEENDLLGGYYYYTQPVEAGATTSALVEWVRTTFETKDKVTDYEIIVYGESVQTLDKNGAEFEGADAYEQAWIEFLGRKGTGNAEHEAIEE